MALVAEHEQGASRKRKRRTPPPVGPYILRPLLQDAPLSVDNDQSHIEITCVDFWEGNLYVGTSASEILHFVSILGEAQDGSQTATFILASRLQPTAPPPTLQNPPGVQSIALLPRVHKACILCNGVLTFYSLPELSPAFPKTKIANCTWIGGRDLDTHGDEAGDEVVMICIRDRIRIVRINEDGPPRLVRNIEYPGCLASARRSRFACVADAHSYALLDVDNQQKIPLFPISSLESYAGSVAGGTMEDLSSTPEQTAARSSSSAYPRSAMVESDINAHNQSTSLGGFVESAEARSTADSRSRGREILFRDNPETSVRSRSTVQNLSPARHGPNIGSSLKRPLTPEKPLPLPSNDPTHPTSKASPPRRVAPMLKPQITSPISTEFLLTTGTMSDEPGVGIFVNCDGDVVRGTLEFSRYPHAVVVDGGGLSMDTIPESLEDNSEGYVLASVTRPTASDNEVGIEIQRWDTNTGEERDWLSLTDDSMDTMNEGSLTGRQHGHAGLAISQTRADLSFPDIQEKLRLRRLRLFHDKSKISPSQIEEWEILRNKQEDEFASRLGQGSSRVLTWTGSSIKWVVRNPQILRLDATIDTILDASSESLLDKDKLMVIVDDIRNREARSETEFLGLDYIRQKASLIMFTNLITNAREIKDRVNEEQILEGNVDPRVILSLIPLLRPDVAEGPRGIWIHAGLVSLMETQVPDLSKGPNFSKASLSSEIFALFNLLKRYLFVWRQRKGFGSISDETEVFSTVDAALLHILLYQDQSVSTGRAVQSSGSIRTELYSVIDNGVSCFERAVDLLEEFQRLYVLSRLYQSRKMSGKVLATWRRILDGEVDRGGELKDGENEVRKYLIKIRDLTLVEEYGTWLARRNPLIGVQVFTDDNSRVKLPPNQVVQLLKLRAPDAVKVYLEHLVFGKKKMQYANDLISYYLDNVLAILKSSSEARSILSQSYESYRALHPPKPTYRQFIIDNAIHAPWWHDRLRFLELLGGSHGAAFSYDVPSILERIEPFEQDLVPESIILDGRQGRHQQAIRLLTHGLGDYHTAINYCLLGGSSIFHPTSGPVDPQSVPSPDEQARLFKFLFSEFLRIDDIGDRIERTSELLARFGHWFDVTYVLNQIPDSWSMELVSAFLVSAFRRLVQEKSEAMITKALSGAENLKVSADFIEKCEQYGAHVETPSI
ncbi:MAG: hypothetical protein Q9187_006171, partial [Circinaria calcarea]